MIAPGKYVSSLLAAAVAAILALPVANADSFMTSVGSESKRAAKIGPPIYAAQSATKAQDKAAARKALKLVKQGNAAVSMDAIRQIDSIALNDERARSPEKFRRGLERLARNPRNHQARFLLAYANMLRDPGSLKAFRALNRAAKELSSDSAVQLGAYQATAQRAFFGEGKDTTRQRLFRMAKAYLAKASALNARSPRPLVTTALKQAREYNALYDEMK